MRRTHTAFTLVELLIVIAIIGILMSILIPALSNSTASARRTACANNMRQIVLAIANYAQDNKDALYNLGGGTTFAPVNCNGSGNLDGLIGPVKYLTAEVGYDPALPKDFRYYTGPGGSRISFYSVMPIVGLPSGVTLTNSAAKPRWSKFSDVPRDKAMVTDVFRVAGNVNHPARNGTPYWNLALRDGSAKTVQMPKPAYDHYQAVPATVQNNWWVHNDLIRVLELVADGRDPSHANMNPQAWPWATGTNASQYSYIPLDGGPTREGRAHALR